MDSQLNCLSKGSMEGRMVPGGGSAPPQKKEY